MAGNEVRIVVTSQDKSGPGLKAARKNADDLGDSTKRVGDIAAGIVGSQLFDTMAQAAGRAFTSTVTAATNLNESINAVNVTFGSAAEGVHALGEESAESIGLSQSAFNQAAVSFANFAQQVAGPGGDVAGVIDDITTRSADFASVMNMDVNQAMDIFRSGLAGESEPLRKYGIDVSAAATETFAYANGIAEAGSELTEAQKVQARYGLIMQETSKFADDFTNTQDEVANATRTAKAQLEDAQAEIGQNLLPVLSMAANAASDLLSVFAALPGPVQAVIGVVGGLAAAFVLVGPKALAAKTAFDGLAANSPGLASGIGKVGKAAGVAVAALAGLMIAKEIGDMFGASEEDIRRWYETLAAGAGGDPAEEIRILKEEIKDLDKITGDVADLDLGPIGHFYNTWDQEVLDTVDKQEFLKERLKELEHQQKLTKLETEAGAGATRDSGQAAQEAAEAQEEAAEQAIEAMTSWTEKATDGATAISEAMGELEEGQKLTTEGIIASLEKQTEQYETWQSNVVEIASKAKGGWDSEMVKWAQESPEAAAAIVDASDAEWADLETQARKRTVDGSEAMSQVLRDHAPELAAIAKHSGEDAMIAVARGMAIRGTSVEQEAERIGLKIDKPTTRSRHFTVTGSVDQGTLNRISSDIDYAARDRNAYISLRYSGSTRALSPYMAHGGISGAQHAQGGGPRGNDTIVGENGPELVELPFGSRVIPSGQTQAQMDNWNGGGSNRLVLEINSGGARLDDLLLEVLRKSIQVRGGDVQLVLGRS